MDIKEYLFKTLTLRQYIGLMENTFKLIVSDDIGKMYPEYFVLNKQNQYWLENYECDESYKLYSFSKRVTISDLLLSTFNFGEFFNKCIEKFKLENKPKNGSMVYINLPRYLKSHFLYKKYGSIKLCDLNIDELSFKTK